MASPVAIVRPERNADLIEHLKVLLAEAEEGEIIGLVGVKLATERRFATLRWGDCSDLELVGALAFAMHDTISANPTKD